MSQNALATIFGDDAYTQVPLEFFSVYKTSPNSDGFYSVEEIRADGAEITNEGVLKRWKCLLSDSSDCDTTTLNLNNIGNASRSFIRQSNIYKDNFSVDGVTGNIVIYGTESRGFRANDSEGTSYSSFCETSETIQFNGTPDTKGINPEYRYGFGRGAPGVADCAILDTYTPTLGVRIEKQGRDLATTIGEDRSPTWAISFQNLNLAQTKVVNSKIFSIVGNDDLNPEPLITEVKDIPFKLTDIDEVRSLLGPNESVIYYYSPNTSPNYDGGDVFRTFNYTITNLPKNDKFEEFQSAPGLTADNSAQQVGDTLFGQAARDKIFDVLSGTEYDYDNMVGSAAPKDNVLFRLVDHQIIATDNLNTDAVTRNYRITPVLDSTTGFIDASVIGAELTKDSIDEFFDGNYATDTTFEGTIEVSEPFTKEEDVTFEIFKGDNFSKSDDYFEIKIKLKFETTSDGIKVSWLDDSIATFNFYDVEDSGSVIISREVPNDSGLDTFNIPSGNYDFSNFAKLGLRWDQILAKFSEGEISSFKNYFIDGGNYSWKINFGEYKFVTKFGGLSSTVSGKFSVADTPKNAVYPVGEYEVSEGSTSNVCFYLTEPAASAQSFDLTPAYQANKPGFVQSGEVTFDLTTVAFGPGETQSCINVTGVSDNLADEGNEVLELSMTNLSSGIVSGRSGSFNLILKEQ